MPPTSLLVPPLVLAVGLIAAAVILARRVGLVVPFAFVVTYALGVGAVTFLNVAVFDMVDPKFRELWVKSWLEIYWPLWSVFFAPSAISALLATWLSRLTKGKEAAMLLGAFLLLILTAIEIAWVLDPYIGRRAPWFLLGAFTFLSTVFVAIAMVARVRPQIKVQPDLECS
jgi:hypothetical protein